MKNLLIGFSLIVFINSCSLPLSSPALDMTNKSDDYIYNIKGTWNGSGPRTVYTKRYPGQSGSESFILERKSDLFGPVRFEWENAKGEKIVKEFEFTKEMLPSFGRKDRGIIYFFFTQNDLEIDVISNKLDADYLSYRVSLEPWILGHEDLTKPEVQKKLAALRADKKFMEYFNKRRARQESIQQIELDLAAICYPGGWGNPPKGDGRPPVSSAACKALMPIYRPSNMPKINKARKIYEEQEKVRKENMRKYQDKKHKKLESAV